MEIKAGSVSNLTDARYFAAQGVTWMGFNFSQSAQNHISAKAYFAIKEWVEGPKFIGEFNSLTVEEYQQNKEFLALDGIQLDWTADYETLKAASKDVLLIRIKLEDQSNLIELHNNIERLKILAPIFVLDFSSYSEWNDKVVTELLNILSDFPKKTFLWDGPIQKQTIPMLLNQENIGLSLRGGEEEAVGLKSYEELDEIFESLELP